MGVNYNTKIVTNGLLLSMDFSNPKCYTSGTSANSLVSPYTCTFKNGATYNSVSNGVISFTRAPTVTTKANDGGGVYFPSLTGTPLASSTFLYNDFTWEIWFRINDRNPSNYDANEAVSSIAQYAGYNAGFENTTSTIRFRIWDGTTTNISVCSWTLGTSTQQVVQGNWYQLAVTKSGTTYTPYVNGAQLGTGSTTTISTVGGTGDLLGIGSVNAANFIWYSIMSFSNMRMYNRALTDNEIQQNFNALRGRFGI